MDIVAIDRALVRASRDLAKERGAKQPDLARVWALHRGVAGKTLYDDVAASSLPAALREGLLQWIATLTVARVTAPAEEAYLEVLRESRAVLEAAPAREVTWAEAWRALLQARDPHDANAAVAALASLAPKLAPLARDLEASRVEATSRLDGAFALLGHDREADTRAAARRFLEATDDLSRDVLFRAQKQKPEAWPLALDVLLARVATDGWPRLSRRLLEELFGSRTQGLRLELRTLPPAVGGASYARALGAFGDAFRRAVAAPSAAARPPAFLEAHRFAATFAALAASATFQRRKLGLSRRVAELQARALAASFLLSLRLACAARLLEANELEHAELGERVFVSPLPGALAGAWPARRLDDQARLLGWLSAPSLASWLVEHHDEDWFDNPRAWADLRGHAAPTATDPPNLEQVARAFVVALA